MYKNEVYLILIGAFSEVERKKIMFFIAFILFCLQYWTFFQQCHGHGYLADPPARSSAWLFDDDFITCCQYYNHMEMFCGGAHYQWVINGKRLVLYLSFV